MNKGGLKGFLRVLYYITLTMYSYIYSYVAGQATLNVVNNNYFEVNLYRKLKAIQLCMLQNQGTIGLFIKIL